MARGSVSSVNFSLQQPRSTDLAVDGQIEVPAQCSVGHPAGFSIAAPPATVQNEFPTVANANCSSYGGSDDGGGGRTAGADWSNFRAGQIRTEPASQWTTGPSGACTAPTENGGWFDAPLRVDGSNSVRTGTDTFDQAPSGPSGVAETGLIANPIRPATPPRMQRLDHGCVESSSIGGGGSGPSAIDRLHNGFDGGGEVSARQSDRGWTGGDVGQEGGRVSGCGIGTEDAAVTESAQVGQTIAKKLDFHDVFLDLV